MQREIDNPKKNHLRSLNIIFSILAMFAVFLAGCRQKPIEQMSKEELLNAAISEFQKVIELAPSDVTGYRYLSEAYTKKGDTEKVGEVWSSAIRANPDQGWPYLEYAIVKAQAKLYDEADALAKQGLNASLDNPLVHWSMSRLYAQPMGRNLSIELLATAINLLETKTKEQIDVNTLVVNRQRYELRLNQWVDSYQRNHSAEETLEKLESAVALVPESPLLFQEIGQFYLSKQDYTAAIANFEQAVQVDSDYTASYAGLASAYYSGSGNCAKAIENQALAVEQDGTLKNRIAFIDYANRCGEEEVVQSAYQTTFAAFPTKVGKEAISLGIKYLSLNLTEPALRIFEEVSKLEPENTEANKPLVRLYLENDNCERAGLFQDRVATVEQKPKEYLQLGDIYVECNNYDQAISAYQKIVEIDNNLLVGHFKLAESYLADNQINEGIGEFLKIIQLNPDHTQPLAIAARDQLTEEIAKIQPCSDMVEQQQRLLEIDRSSRSLLELGNLYLVQCNDPTQAILAYQDLIKSDPNLLVGYFQLGLSYEKIGKIDEAIEAMEQILALNPQRDKEFSRRAALKLTQYRPNQPLPPVATGGGTTTESQSKSAKVRLGQIDLRYRPIAGSTIIVTLSPAPQTVMVEARSWDSRWLFVKDDATAKSGWISINSVEFPSIASVIESLPVKVFGQVLGMANLRESSALDAKVVGQWSDLTDFPEIVQVAEVGGRARYQLCCLVDGTKGWVSADFIKVEEEAIAKVLSEKAP